MWLDHVSYTTSLWRIVKRFVSLRLLVRRRGAKFVEELGPSGCHGHLHEVVGLSMFTTRYYFNKPPADPSRRDDDANCRAAGERLARYPSKLVQCRALEDLESARLAILTAAADRVALGGPVQMAGH